MIEHPCHRSNRTCQCTDQRHHFEPGNVLQSKFVIIPAIEPVLSEYGRIFEATILEIFQEGGAEELTATHAFAGCQAGKEIHHYAEELSFGVPMVPVNKHSLHSLDSLCSSPTHQNASSTALSLDGFIGPYTESVIALKAHA